MKILKILPILLILTEFFSQISGYDSNGANSQDSRGLEESQKGLKPNLKTLPNLKDIEKECQVPERNPKGFG